MGKTWTTERLSVIYKGACMFSSATINSLKLKNIGSDVQEISKNQSYEKVIFS